MKTPDKARDKHARRDWIRELERNRDPAVRALAVGLKKVQRDPTKTGAQKQAIFTQAAVEFARDHG